MQGKAVTLDDNLSRLIWVAPPNQTNGHFFIQFFSERIDTEQKQRVYMEKESAVAGIKPTTYQKMI